MSIKAILHTKYDGEMGAGEIPIRSLDELMVHCAQPEPGVYVWLELVATDPPMVMNITSHLPWTIKP